MHYDLSRSDCTDFIHIVYMSVRQRMNDPLSNPKILQILPILMSYSLKKYIRCISNEDKELLRGYCLENKLNILNIDNNLLSLSSFQLMDSNWTVYAFLLART